MRCSSGLATIMAVLPGFLFGCTSGSDPSTKRDGTSAETKPLLPTSEQEVTWESFTSVEGGFSVSFPGKPSERVTPLEGHTNKSYWVQQNGRMFAAGFTHLTENLKKLLRAAPAKDRQRLIESQLDLSQESAIAGMKAKFLDQKEVSLGTHSGREFKFQLPDTRLGIQQVYLVNERVYAISVGGPGHFVDSDKARRFLGSFKLINEKEMQEKKE